MTTTAYVALGCNLGPRKRIFEAALEWMARDPAVRIEAVSPFVETAPMGPDQPAYLNAVVRLGTSHPPEVLLALLQRVERLLGRHRRGRWGARTLDLDLLLYGTRRLARRHLTVPHPGVGRPFLKAPLAAVREPTG